MSKNKVFCNDCEYFLQHKDSMGELGTHCSHPNNTIETKVNNYYYYFHRYETD